METILKTSSISETTKEVRVNHDKTTTYIDFHQNGELKHHFIMSKDDWDMFILDEYVSIYK